jgi:hypothetical protein
MAARRLPFELQTLLLHLPTFRTPYHVSLPPSYLRRAISLPAHSDLFARPLSSLAEDSRELPTGPALFESPSLEYTEIPLSTLDYPKSPRSPRSPDDALLALIDAKQYADADSLLRDLLDSSQPIPPRYLFAKHAEYLFNEDPKSSWLDWWSLAPSLTSRALKDSHAIKSTAQGATRRANRIISKLLIDDWKDWERLRDFGVVLARQGHSRVVAERLLVHFAAYGPLELGEELWNTSLAAVKQKMNDLALMAGFEARSRSRRWAERRMGVEGRRRASEQRITPRTGPSSTWLANQCRHEMGVLIQKRERMVRAHANLGRLDLATSLLESMRGQTGLGDRKLKLSKSAYIALLSIAALSDRFDIFERIYADLERRGGRLTRVRHRGLQQRTPYFARGINTPAPDSVPSVQEAFATFRYSTYVGALEEGEPESLEAGADRHQTPQELLVQLNKRMFDDASRTFMAILADGNLPLPLITAQFIQLARAKGKFEFLETMSDLFDPKTSGASSRMAGYWTTSMMLAHVQAKEWPRALVLFKRYFDHSGLPLLFKKAFNAAVRPVRPINHEIAIPPDAYALSIATQALVPFLDGRRHVSRATLIDELYVALVNESFNVIPFHSKPSSPSSSLDIAAPGSTCPPSPLDPFTFVPFLTSFARRRLPPHTLLRVLIDMQRLSVRPAKQHYGIILGAYARSGTPSDLFYLLDTLEGRQPTTVPSLELVEHLDRIRKGIRLCQVDVIGYTGMLTGLIAQKELEAARDLVRRMEVGEGREVWKADWDLRRAVIKLNGKGLAGYGWAKEGDGDEGAKEGEGPVS